MLKFYQYFALPKEKTHIEYWKYLWFENDATTDSSRNHINGKRPTVDDMHDYIISVFTSVA